MTKLNATVYDRPGTCICDVVRVNAPAAVVICGCGKWWPEGSQTDHCVTCLQGICTHAKHFAGGIAKPIDSAVVGPVAKEALLSELEERLIRAVAVFGQRLLDAQDQAAEHDLGTYRLYGSTDTKEA